MATQNGDIRVTFGNRWTGFDGTEYEQGKTYDVPARIARHLLRVGKVRRADDEPDRNTAKPDATAATKTTTTGRKRAGTDK